ncbi:MAG: type IX secretion system protein PorQ [Ignavibacteria bacterium]
MKLVRFFAVIILLVSLSKNLSAQSAGAFDFLRLDLNPRAAALAGSYVANTDDPNVMFYNPAGINSIGNMPVSFSYVSHLMDISLAGLSIVRNYEGYGHFAFGVSYINYGVLTRANEMGVKTGEFKAGEVAFILGYANKLDENFFYGANFKYIYSGIDNISATALAMDLGLQYHLPVQQLTIGFSVLNMGSQIKKYYTQKEDLPLDIRIGLSKRFERLPVRLYLSFNNLNKDKSKFSDRLTSFTFGGEFNLSKGLRMRLGYDNQKRKDFKIGSTSGLAGINIGLGAVIKDYNFDYSYSSLGLLGSISRIGITTSF